MTMTMTITTRMTMTMTMTTTMTTTMTMTTTTAIMERARVALQERLAVQYNCDFAVTNRDASSI
jgi:hypothetical protein